VQSVCLPLLSIQVQIQISPGSLTDGNYIPPLFSSSSLVGLIQTGQCPSCCCPAQALRNGVRSGDANCGGNLRDIELRSQGRRVRCSIWAILASHPSKAGPKKKPKKQEKKNLSLSLLWRHRDSHYLRHGVAKGPGPTPHFQPRRTYNQDCVARPIRVAHELRRPKAPT